MRNIMYLNSIMDIFFGERRTLYYPFPTMCAVGIWRIWCQAALYLWGGTERTFTERTQCHLAAGVRERAG